MTLWTPATIDVPGLEALDAALPRVPNHPAVFLIHAKAGAPYLGRTTLLRRRLLRLLKERAQPSRLLNLRSVAARVEYRLTASWLESSLVFYEQARRYFPETYPQMMKLRMPPYVKIILSNKFPRSQVTTRLGGPTSLYYGPFRSRASAEQFESQFLDLFQIRRCQEDLKPAQDHPGCIYGEMGMCLRPCQLVVGPEEYQSEVSRVVQFLSSDGKSLLEAVTHARDRLSAEMNFEEAARQHRQLEKVQSVLKLRDELVRNTESLSGVAVTQSVLPGHVELWFLTGGCWQAPRRFGFDIVDGKTVSLDQRLRELTATLTAPRISTKERQEHLALFARWRYSSWNDGEWIPFANAGEIPFRKVVNAISRVLREREKP